MSALRFWIWLNLSGPRQACGCNLSALAYDDFLDDDIDDPVDDQPPVRPKFVEKRKVAGAYKPLQLEDDLDAVPPTRGDAVEEFAAKHKAPDKKPTR